MFLHQRTRSLCGLVLAFGVVLAPHAISAQNPPANNQLKAADAKAEEALKQTENNEQEAAPTPVTVAPAQHGPDLFGMWFQGGPLMYPITAISLIVVALTFERLIGLRRSKTVPFRLSEGLRQLAKTPNFDPRQGYQLCQQYPSTLANVMKVVLLKVGRPVTEIEHAYKEICEREAAKLYKNVRTINLAVTITPLIGLLGTVQGMIECFYTTANLAVGADKSQALAQGIYVALLTTFGGLVVAIPAAVISHYFEGLIQARFRDIDELAVNVVPNLERYEGKVRMTRQSGEPQPTGTA